MEPSRPLRDMKGLLQFCMEATRSEDASSQSIMEPMTEERKRWLEEALNTMTVNPVERLQLCLKMIDEAEVDTEQGTDQQVQALTELQDWLEDMDIAADFIKINGLRVVPKLLSSEVSEIRWRGLEMLGNMCQNNPKVQAALLDLQLLPPMLLLLEADPNPTVRVKALYAISCLVRSNPQALNQFIDLSGLSALAKSITNSSDHKLRVKATFLISSICSKNPALKDSLVNQGVIEHLLKLLKEEEHDSTHEHILSALVALASHHAGAKQACLSSDFDVRDFLRHRIDFLDGKESFQEEKEYAGQLLQILNGQDRSPSGPDSCRQLSVVPALK